MNSQIKLRNFRQRRMILWEMTVEQQLTIYRGTTRWLNYYSPSKFGHIFFVHPFKVQNPRAKNSQATTVLVYWLPIPNENGPFLDAGTIFSRSDSIFEVQFMHIFLVNFGVITCSKYYCTTKLRGKTNVFLWNLKVLFNCSVAKGMCQTRQFANHGL